MHEKQKQCIQLGRIPKVRSEMFGLSITTSKQMLQDNSSVDDDVSIVDGVVST